jgi:hypothetical protein
MGEKNLGRDNHFCNHDPPFLIGERREVGVNGNIFKSYDTI